MNLILSFLKEAWLRLVSKSPIFNKVLQILGIIAAAIAAAPTFLASIGVNVDILQEPYKTILLVAGIVTTIVAQFGVSKDSVNIDKVK
jgi:hypothetical protein